MGNGLWVGGRWSGIVDRPSSIVHRRSSVVTGETKMTIETKSGCSVLRKVSPFWRFRHPLAQKSRSRSRPSTNPMFTSSPAAYLTLRLRATFHIALRRQAYIGPADETIAPQAWASRSSHEPASLRACTLEPVLPSPQMFEPRAVPIQDRRARETGPRPALRRRWPLRPARRSRRHRQFLSRGSPDLINCATMARVLPNAR